MCDSGVIGLRELDEPPERLGRRLAGEPPHLLDTRRLGRPAIRIPRVPGPSQDERKPRPLLVSLLVLGLLVLLVFEGMSRAVLARTASGLWLLRYRRNDLALLETY